MAISNKMIKVSNDVTKRFIYEVDEKGKDTWTLLGPAGKGDCDDFAYTMAYELSNGSNLKLLMNVLSGRCKFWYCETAQGEPHMQLEWDGYFIDNIYPTWSKSSRHLSLSKAKILTVIYKTYGLLALIALAITPAVLILLLT